MKLLPTVLVCSVVHLLAAGCSPNQTPLPERDPYAAEAELTLPCLPNLDGQITAEEASPSFGATASYLVSPAGTTRSIDLEGRENADGTRRWDFSVDDASDQALRISPTPVTGKWYAGSFPDNAFVTPLDAAGRNDNILSIDESSLKLLGVASKEEDGPSGKTLLVYNPPIDLYRFPLAPGVKYESSGEVRNGVFQNIPYAGRDTYEVEVDGIGEVALPDLTVTQALRVRVTATVVPSAGQTTVTQQTSFLFECLGEVVRATSAPGDTNRYFSEAAEVRRLGLFP